MIIEHKKDYKNGYNPITYIDDLACMDFGIIYLHQGGEYCNSEDKERAILLINGCVTVAFEGQTYELSRNSFLNESPACVHLPQNVEIRIKAHDNSELAYQAVKNDTVFASKLYGDCITEEFGKGVMGNTSLRRVRTIIDDEIAPYSNLVIGEVVNFPGRWSSYPPHHHIQPEVYHYRMYPEQGFGFSCEGEDVNKVRNRDTAVISGSKVHPQTVAPGYAMYYIWMIPHTPKRWEKDREFLKEDEWLLVPGPDIWDGK